MEARLMRQPLRKQMALAIGGAALLVTGSIIGGGLALANGEEGTPTDPPAAIAPANEAGRLFATFGIASAGGEGDVVEVACARIEELDPGQLEALKAKRAEFEAGLPTDAPRVFSERAGALKEAIESGAMPAEDAMSPSTGAVLRIERAADGELPPPPPEGATLHCGPASEEEQVAMLEKVDAAVAAGEMSTEDAERMRAAIESGRLMFTGDPVLPPDGFPLPGDTPPTPVDTSSTSAASA